MSLLNPILATATIDVPATKRVGSVKRSTLTLHRSGLVTTISHYPYALDKHKPFTSASFSLWDSPAKPNPDYLRRSFDRLLDSVNK